MWWLKAIWISHRLLDFYKGFYTIQEKNWSYFFEFQTEAWPSLDQLNGDIGTFPIFHLGPLKALSSALNKSVHILLM